MEGLGKEPMRITVGAFSAFPYFICLTLENIPEKNPDVELEGGGWIGSSDPLSDFMLAPWLTSTVGPILLFIIGVDLTQGQPFSFSKQGLWKMDPHEPHFAASAS